MDGIFVGEEHQGGTDNLLCCFDPTYDGWTKVDTKGTTPSPRKYYAAAVVGCKAYIHGGYRSYTSLRDLHELDMETMTWTHLTDAGPMDYGHSLTPSPAGERFFLIAKKEIWTYDRCEGTWEKDAEFGLPEKMSRHCAIPRKTETGISILCMGGNNSDNDYPRYIVVIGVIC